MSTTKNEELEFPEDDALEADEEFVDTEIQVDHTESRIESVTYRNTYLLSDIRDWDVFEGMSDEEILEAVKESPGDYFEELYCGEIVYDKTKDMGSFTEVTFS